MSRWRPPISTRGRPDSNSRRPPQSHSEVRRGNTERLQRGQNQSFRVQSHLENSERQGYGEVPQHNVKHSTPVYDRVPDITEHPELEKGQTGSKKRPAVDSEGGKRQEISFCAYCGEDVSSGQGEDQIYHEECIGLQAKIIDAVKLFRLCESNYDNVLFMAIHVNYLYGLKNKQKDPNKTEKRQRKLKELARKVSSLRNSNSGYILIHLVGLAPGDTYTGFFDEFADPKLKNLIIDGSLFDDVYRKGRFSELDADTDDTELSESIAKFPDYLFLYVDGSDYLTTADFKTKIALDDCIIDPDDLSVLKFLNQKKGFREEFPTVIKDISSLRESRVIQLKSYLPKLHESPVNYMHRLNLKENISAFTKNKDGGSYYLGVRETDTSFEGARYTSKTSTTTPVPVSDQRQLEQAITVSVRENIIVCDYDGNVVTKAQIVKVDFVPLPDGDNLFVICVAVRPVSGIVFYDKSGPLAFIVDKEDTTDGVKQLELSEWFEMFKRRSLR